MDSVLEQYFSFATTLEALKKLERFRGHFYWRDYPQPIKYESVADHTWRLAILVILFEDKLSQKIDLEKALKIALVHDIPEIIAGDAHPLGEKGDWKETYANKADLQQARFLSEKNAAEQLFGMLPEGKKSELYDLWLEYEEKSSFEAKVVKALDKIECFLQVLEYRDGHMFSKHLEQSIEYSMKESHVDPALEQFGRLIESKMRDRFIEFA